MSASVRPADRLPVGASPADEDHYRLAVEEARAQAEALRHAVSRANDLVRQLEELVESLRAILLYPKAYDWPPIESETGESVVEVDEAAAGSA
jgi:multidrug resistance efflux pump